MSTLVGWVGGDSYKYSPHFHPCASPNRKIHNSLAERSIFSYKGALSSSRFAQFSNSLWTLVGGEYHRGCMLTIRLAAIILQRLYYGNAPPSTALAEEDDLEQALALAEE